MNMEEEKLIVESIRDSHNRFMEQLANNQVLDSAMRVTVAAKLLSSSIIYFVKNYGNLFNHVFEKEIREGMDRLEEK